MNCQVSFSRRWFKQFYELVLGYGKHWPMIGLLAVLIALPRPVTAVANDRVAVLSLKAAFLFNFARFIEWPVDGQNGDNNKRFFCFYRADDLAQVFAEITEGAWLGQRQVMIRRLADQGDVSQCDLLFSSETVPPLVNSVGLLTVGDGLEFTENGGIIGLIRRRQNLRFVVNREAAEAAKLIVSSQLLKLVFLPDGGREGE